MSLMILEDGLQKYLVSRSEITDLTGGPSGIFLNSVPQSSHDPCLSIQKISATPDFTNDGPSGLNSRRYQICTYSKAYGKAITLQETVRTVLDGFTGFFPNGQKIYAVIRDNELDGFDDVTDEHRTITDYFIHFAE